MQLYYSELENEVRLIKLTGVLDLIGVGLVERKLAEHVAGANAQVILDLSEVSFIASIGIRLLVTTAKSVGRGGGRLVIFNPSQSVREILDLTGVVEIIPMFGDLEEARSALAS
jgi:anti-anti-sigma factor